MHEARYVFPDTEEAYSRQAKAHKLAVQTVELPHGAKGNWIGDPDADYVLIWYHGACIHSAA